MKKLNQTVLKTIRNADSATLDAIIAEIRMRQRTIQQEIAVSFRKGDKVRFDAKNRGIIEGIIEKINQKTIKIKQTNGANVISTTWSVSPSLLKKVA